MLNDQSFVNNNWSLTQNTITRTRTRKFRFDCQKFLIRQFMYDTIWIYIDIIDWLLLKFDDCRECFFCCNTFIFLCIFVRFHSMSDFKSIFRKKRYLWQYIDFFFLKRATHLINYFIQFDDTTHVILNSEIFYLPWKRSKRTNITVEYFRCQEKKRIYRTKRWTHSNSEKKYINVLLNCFHFFSSVLIFHDSSNHRPEITTIRNINFSKHFQ